MKFRFSNIAKYSKLSLLPMVIIGSPLIISTSAGAQSCPNEGLFGVDGLVIANQGNDDFDGRVLRCNSSGNTVQIGDTDDSFINIGERASSANGGTDGTDVTVQIGDDAGDILNVIGTSTLNGPTTLNGLTTTNGINNTGAINTDTLNAAGAVDIQGLTTTNGIDNTGAINTDTLNAVGAVDIQGLTTTNGIDNTGAINTDTLDVAGTLEVDGTTTLNGPTTTNGLTNNGNLVLNGLPNSGSEALLVIEGDGRVGVNTNIIDELRAGIAATIAMDNAEAELRPGHRFGVGIGFGTYNDEVAIGTSAKFLFTDPNSTGTAVTFKGSAGWGINSDAFTAGAGLGLSF